MNTPLIARDWVLENALAFGFHDVGITHTHHDYTDDLCAYLSEERHGEMSWLGERVDWRGAPHKLWPEARAIIMLAEAYPPSTGRIPPGFGEISTYARGQDYHDVVKKRLKNFGRALIENFGGEIKVFVDTAPIMEKPLAQMAGMGWQGKHGNIVSRRLGNWFFLGSVFTTLALEPDAPENNHCGRCRACLDICPTRAFDSQGRLDPRRCISYLSIEYAGIIPDSLARHMGNLIYGCDLCLDACPWNKFATTSFDLKLAPRPENIAPDLGWILSLDDAGFRAWQTKTAIKRIGYARMMRNALIAAGNSGGVNLVPEISAFLDHTNSVLRETSNWALQRLRERGVYGG